MDLLLLTKSSPPRLIYTLEIIFGQLLGLSYRITHSINEFRAYDGAKLSYGVADESSSLLHIPAHSLLYETAIQPQMLQMGTCSELPTLFAQSDPSILLPFDLPAAVFYLISRYEEYLPFTPDAHGRFPATASVAYQHQFLHLPLTQLWVHQLAKALLKIYPRLPVRTPTYRCLPTYDVDIAWAYRYRKSWKQGAAMLQELLKGQYNTVRERIGVWTNRRPDPFQSFSYLDELHQRFKLRPIYFFLLSSGGPYDKNTHPAEPAFQQLIRTTAATYPCGIHPSYRSNTDPKLLLQEISRLRDITGQAIEESRQHYLKLQFPATYQQLLTAGLREDYTMGYADQIGFRASIAVPFRWYDLSREAPTELMVHPFQVMDVTLKDYLQLTPSEALTKVQPLIDVTRAYGGCFTTLWHNSSFSDHFGWTGWQEAYTGLLEEMTE